MSSKNYEKFQDDQDYDAGSAFPQFSDPDQQKKPFSNSFRSIYNNDEVLDDLCCKQLNQDWERLGRNPDWNSQNFKKWLQFYTKNSSRHHEIDPETLLSKKNIVVQCCYLEQKNCLVEVYEQGQIVFTEFKTKKKVIVNNIEDKVIEVKTNKAETLVGLVYTNYMIFIELNGYSIINTLKYHYQESLKFAFNQKNEAVVCLGCNLLTKCGLSLWNIKENKFEQYTDNNFECEKITHVIFDIDGIKVYFINAKKTLSVWYLATNTIRIIEQLTNCLFESSNFLAIDQHNENLIIGAWTKDDLSNSNFFLNIYSIKNEGKEIKVNEILLNPSIKSKIVWSYPSDSFVLWHLAEEEQNIIIKYDFEKKQEVQKLILDFGETNSKNCSFLSIGDEILVYNEEEHKICNFVDGKLAVKYNLEEFKEEEKASNDVLISFKNFEVDNSISGLDINPFNRNVGAFFYNNMVIIFDLMNMKMFKKIEGNELMFTFSSFFVDENHIAFVETDPPTLIHQNLNSGERNQINIGGKKLNAYHIRSSEKILYCYENQNEIFEWRIQPKIYKDFVRYHAELICSFERGIENFCWARNLEYIIVNLVNTSTFAVLKKVLDFEKIIELKGHTQPIHNFQIIQKKDFLVSICKDKKIVVWDLKRLEQINVILAGSLLKDARISNQVLALGEDGKYLAICKNNSVFIWDIQNSFLVNFFETQDDVNFLTLDSETNVLYTYSSACMFQKWILEKNFDLFTETGKKSLSKINKCYYCTFSPDFKFFFLESRCKNLDHHSRSFLTWPNQTIVKESKLNIEDYYDITCFYTYLWTKNNEGVLFATTDQLIFIYLAENQVEWDIKNLNFLRESLDGISDLYFDQEYYIFYLVTQQGAVIKCCMNVQKRTFSSFKYEAPLLEFTVNAVAVSPFFSFEVALGSNQGDLIIYDFKEFKKIRNFDGHENSISAIAFSHNGKKICSCSENSVIGLWDIGSEALETKFIGHKLSIKFVHFSLDDSKLLSCGQDSTIRIWNLNTKAMERLIEVDEDILINNCEFCNEGTCIAGSFNEGMILNLFDFDYYILQSKAIFYLRNNKDFDDLCTLFKPWTLNQLAFNFIRPFGFSLLHSLFYLGFFEEIYMFIKILRFHKCRFTFLVDCTNKTIIDLLLDRKAIKLLSQLIEYMIDLPPTDAYVSDQFHSSILKLISKQLPSIEKFLDSRIHSFPIKGEYYSQLSEDIETFTTTIKNIHPCIEEFKEKFPEHELESSNENLKLGFQVVNLKQVCDPQTNFCERMMNYPNIHPIFKSIFATSVVGYKWDTYGKNIHLKRFANFFFFTLVATLNSYYFFIERLCYPDNEFYSYSCIICEVVIFVFFFLPYIWYELQDALKTGLTSYFSEFWNWIDFFTLILFVFLFVIDSLDVFISDTADFNTGLKILHSLFTFIMWLKLLSFSIIFEGTAFIYTALIKIIQELGNFLLLLLTLTVMFSFMVFILQDLYPDQSEDYDSDSGYTKMSRGQILFICYKMILGDYDDFFSVKPTLSTLLFKFLFILVTILMFIILMNFIISLVGMVFSDVVSVKDLTYLYEKNKIIAEIDRAMSPAQRESLMNEKNMNAYLLICQTNISDDFQLAETNNKAQKSIMDNEKTYFHTKIPNSLIDKINFTFGANCENCKKELKEMSPQYCCYFCNVYFCAECGNKIDSTKKGSYSTVHPHHLVWIDVKNEKGMRKIDKYKLNSPKIFEENDKDFHSACNGCRGEMDNSRWLCLSCRPGKYRLDGYVDFCENCMDVIINKDPGEKMKSILERISDEDHDMESHIYLRILFANSYKGY